MADQTNPKLAVVQQGEHSRLMDEYYRESKPILNRMVILELTQKCHIVVRDGKIIEQGIMWEPEAKKTYDAYATLLDQLRRQIFRAYLGESDARTQP